MGAHKPPDIYQYICLYFVWYLPKFSSPSELLSSDAFAFNFALRSFITCHNHNKKIQSWFKINCFLNSYNFVNTVVDLRSLRYSIRQIFERPFTTGGFCGYIKPFRNGGVWGTVLETLFKLRPKGWVCKYLK